MFILLPVLNEVDNVAPLLDGIERALADVPHTICIVDDGSTDGTSAYLERRMAAPDHHIHLIRRSKTARGSQRGGALQTALQWGLDRTDHAVFVEMDGDLSHRPEELHEGIRLVSDGHCDVAIASKYAPASQVINRPLSRRLVSRVCSGAVATLISRRLRDYSNGYRFYTREAARVVAEHRIRYTSPIYLTEVLALWLRRGMKVIEIPSIYVGRNEGLSKLRLVDLAKASLAVFEVALRYHVTGFAPRSAGSASDEGLPRSVGPGEAAAADGDRSRFGNYVVHLVAIVVLGMAATLFLFREPASDVDHLGLFNPVYMYLTTGRMTYPVHYQFDTMTIHPPVRYLEVALLMKLGLAQYYAQSIMIFLLTVVAAALILTSRFADSTRIALLFAVSATTLYLADSVVYSLRPDLQLAVAWMAGLIALESGRIGPPSAGRFFLGSLLVTYAGGLHYFAAPGVLGIMVYGGWAAWTLPRRAAVRCLAALALGALVFALPYTVLFLIPDIKEIRRIISDVQSGGDLAGPIRRHWEFYRYRAGQIQYSALSFPSVGHPLQIGWLVSIFHSTMVPVFLIGGALLGFNRQLRGLALASLPLCAFVLLVSKQKSAGYFLPETFVLLAGIAIVVGIGLRRVSRALAPTFGASVASAMLAIGVVAFITSTKNPVYERITPGWGARLVESEIARAAAREMVGPRALIGGRIGLWYISGADRWYDVSADVLWPQKLPTTDLARYFDVFDYVVDHRHMSNVTYNERQESIASWYASGLLKLHGFFFGSHGGSGNFVVLATRPTRQVTGFVWRERVLRRFDQLGEVSHVFVTAICPMAVKGVDYRGALPYFSELFLPEAVDGVHGSTSRATDLSRVRMVALSTVVAREEFPRVRSTALGECEMRDLVPGRLAVASLPEVLEKRLAHERPMSFDRFAVSRRLFLGPPRGPTREVEGAVDVRTARLGDTEAKVRLEDGLAVSTGTRPGGYAAVISLQGPNWPGATRGYVKVTLQARDSAIGVGVLDTTRRRFVVEQTVEPTEEFIDIYLEVGDMRQASELVIRNGVTGKRARVVVKSASVLVAGG